MKEVSKAAEVLKAPPVIEYEAHAAMPSAIDAYSADFLNAEEYAVSGVPQ